MTESKGSSPTIRYKLVSDTFTINAKIDIDGNILEIDYPYSFLGKNVKELVSWLKETSGNHISFTRKEGGSEISGKIKNS